MKRWLVVLLVVLAVLVLVSPGIVGRMAERNLEENIEWAESEAVGIDVQTESFDRGWFTSEGRHRVALTGSTFRDALRSYQNEAGYEDLPSLVIDTRVDHGLVAVGSLNRDSGSLLPGLASMISTFHVDPGNGELKELPGTLFSNVGLTGAASLRFLLESGEFQNDDVQIAWQGADVDVQANNTMGAYVIDGRLEPFTIAADGETVDIAAITVSADQLKSDYGFYVGTAALDIESLVAEISNAPGTIGNISFSADASIDDERLSVTSKTAIAEMVIPGMGEMDFALDLSLNRLDAAAMQIINEAFKEAQGAINPDEALAELFPQIEPELQKIVAAGAEIRIDQLDVTLPQGKMMMSMNVNVPEGDGAADFSWGSVLLNVTAAADIRMPASLFDMLQMMNPDAGGLIAMGIMIRDGEDYVMNAEFENGQLQINGAPLPFPIPGM